MNDIAVDAMPPLSCDEVRVYTLDVGDSARVREFTRRILASLGGMKLDDVDLYATPKGKPLLRNDPSLHFSISHSREVAMIAVTHVAAVGVDIEQLRVVPNAEAILRRFFTHEDVDSILASDNRDLRFVEAWTRAEARVKVRGASIWDAATPDPHTTVLPLRAPDGFAAAIAVASRVWAISQYDVSIGDALTL